MDDKAKLQQARSKMVDLVLDVADHAKTEWENKGAYRYETCMTRLRDALDNIQRLDIVLGATSEAPAEAPGSGPKG